MARRYTLFRRQVTEHRTLLGIGSSHRLKHKDALLFQQVTRSQTFFSILLKDGAAPVILLENVTDGILRNLRAADGSGTFLEFRGVGNKDLSAHGNELRKAARSLAFTEGASSTLIKVQ